MGLGALYYKLAFLIRYIFIVQVFRWEWTGYNDSIPEARIAPSETPRFAFAIV